VQVRGRPCNCEWPHQCDSQLQQLPPTRSLLAAQAAGTVSPAATPPALESTQLSESHSAAAAPQAGIQCGAILEASTGCSSDQGPGGAAGQPAVVQAAAGGRGMAAAANGTGSGAPDPEAACQRLEDQFVNAVYNEIAPHFHSTR
jgi:hypothetical protein